MKIESVKIIDSRSTFNSQVVDIELDKNIITKITKLNIDSEKFISPGWVDCGCQIPLPGFDLRENWNSLSKAGISGGFTHIIAFPNTFPAIDHPDYLNSLQLQSKSLPFSVHFLGALSQKLEGKELCDIGLLNEGGVVGFSDGLNPHFNENLLIRVLQYTQNFNKPVVIVPFDSEVSPGGQINEGFYSVFLGMKGISTLSETLPIQKCLHIAQYTNSKLHFTPISSKAAIEILNVNQNKKNITTSFSPQYLFFTDKDTESFDSNIKVYPPYRTENDQNAIIEAIQNGTITTMASMHQPLSLEDKNVEFSEAEAGIANLEIAAPLAYELLVKNKMISLEHFVDILAVNPRNIFNLNSSIIEIGNEVDLTLFSLSSYKYSIKKTKACNTPFLGKEFSLKVEGIFNNEVLSF